MSTNQSPPSPFGGDQPEVNIRPLSDFRPNDFIITSSHDNLKEDMDKHNLSFQYQEVIAFKSLLSLRGADDGDSSDDNSQRPSQGSLGRLSFNSSNSSHSNTSNTVISPSLPSINDENDEDDNLSPLNNNNTNITLPQFNHSVSPSRRPLQRTKRNPKGLKAIIDEANQQPDDSGRLSLEILDIPNFFKVVQQSGGSTDSLINRQHRVNGHFVANNQHNQHNPAIFATVPNTNTDSSTASDITADGIGQLDGMANGSANNNSNGMLSNTINNNLTTDKTTSHKSSSLFNSVLTTSSHCSDSAEEEHMVFAALNGHSHSHFTSPGNNTMSSTDYDGSIASISRISGIFSSSSSEGGSDNEDNNVSPQDDGKLGVFHNKKHHYSSKKQHQGGFYSQRITLPDIPDDQLHDDADHSSDGDDPRLQVGVSGALQQRGGVQPLSQQQRSFIGTKHPPLQGASLPLISSPSLTTLSLNPSATASPLTLEGLGGQTASPKAVTPPLKALEASNSNITTIKSTSSTPLISSTSIATTSPQIGKAASVGVPVVSPVLTTKNNVSPLDASVLMVQTSNRPLDSSVLTAKAPTPLEPAVLTTMGSQSLATSPQAIAFQNNLTPLNLNTNSISSTTASKTPPIAKTPTAAKGPGGSEVGTVNAHNISKLTSPTTATTTPRAISRKNDFDTFERQMIFPIPPPPEEDGLDHSPHSSLGSSHGSPQQQEIQLKSILKPAKKFSPKLFIPGISPEQPAGLGGNVTTNASSIGGNTRNVDNKNNIKLSTVSSPLPQRSSNSNAKNVTFIKPSEELLQLRIRFYTAQKEEQNQIIINPQKRPKRHKKGFFASVKSLFSKDHGGNSTPKNGSAGHNVFSPDGNGNNTSNGSNGSRRGSITKDNSPNTPTFSGISSSSSNTPTISPSTPNTLPSISSNNAISHSPRTSPNGNPSGTLPPLSLNNNSNNNEVVYNRRGSFISQQSPSHSLFENNDDFMSEDDPSDSDYDNREPECITNTKYNTQSTKIDICDLLMNWEMFYTGFKEFTPRDSTNFVSFHQ